MAEEAAARAGRVRAEAKERREAKPRLEEAEAEGPGGGGGAEGGAEADSDMRMSEDEEVGGEKEAEAEERRPKTFACTQAMVSSLNLQCSLDLVAQRSNSVASKSLRGGSERMRARRSARASSRVDK